MSVEFLDPTHESWGRGFALAPRLATLRGITIGIVSNGKKGTKPFFDALADEFTSRYGVAQVMRVTKANYSAPAEPGLLSEAARWQALVAGIGD